MKINLVGFSSAQSKGINTKDVINFSNLLKDILVDSGHEADYGLEDRDLNIVFVLTLGSLNINNLENALEILQNENSIIAFDDWNLRQFYDSIDKYLDGVRLFKTHPKISKFDLSKYRDVLENIRDGKYKALFPAYKNGDHSLLGIRGEQHAIDPSIYIYKERPFETEVSTHKFHLLPVHASLAKKWSNLDKKKYSILNLREENENTVFEYYCRHRIVLSPPHYHDGSGWFRNRYSLANLAKAIVIEDDNSVFGQSYSIKREDVTNANIDQLYELQNSAYYRTIMSKEEISKVLEKVL